MNELNIGLAITGLAVYATPFLNGVAQSPIACPEIGTYGIYQSDMAGAAGEYDIIFTVIANLVETTCGVGKIKWDGTEEVSALTVSEIAAGVRENLATELGRIDVPVSDALAAVDYVAPDNAGIAAIPTTPLLAADYTAPDNGAIATAVRLELATELSAIIIMLKTLKNKREIKKVGAVWTLFVYDNDTTTPILSKELKDVAGNNITDIAAGLLAVEMASTV